MRIRKWNQDLKKVGAGLLEARALHLKGGRAERGMRVVGAGYEEVGTIKEGCSRALGR
jgi:hypothetical protein